MTEYTVLIFGDADRWWTQLTPEERDHGYAEHGRFAAALAAGGHTIVGGGELTHVREARSIPAGGGPATDGPYAESVEQVGGFYQVATDDLDGLVECCQIIAGTGDGIEIRRTVDPESRS